MTLASAPYHEQNFALLNALGEKRTGGNFSMVPAGLEAAYLVIKQFPVPVTSVGEAIEVYGPGGLKTHQAQPVKVFFTGAIGFSETIGDAARNFMRQVISRGSYFDATIYDGTPDRHAGGWKIKKASVTLDAFDADWENQGALMNFTGTISFNFFDETVQPSIGLVAGQL